MDENKDKVALSEKSHIFFACQLSTCCSIPSPRNQGQNALERCKRTSSGQNTAAVMYAVLLSTSSRQESGPSFTLVTGRVTGPAALENLRNELRSYPVSVLAFVCSVQ